MNLIFRCKEGGDQFDSAYIFYLGMTLVTGSKCLRFFQNFQFQFEKKKWWIEKKKKKNQSHKWTHLLSLGGVFCLQKAAFQSIIVGL